MTAESIAKWRESQKSRPRMMKWAKNHERCASCGSTSRKHRGNGLCDYCYRHQKRVTDNPKTKQRGPYHSK